MTGSENERLRSEPVRLGEIEAWIEYHPDTDDVMLVCRDLAFDVPGLRAELDDAIEMVREDIEEEERWARAGRRRRADE